MKELSLKPEDIVMPLEYGIGSMPVLRVYFDLFRKGADNYVSPILVIQPKTVLPAGKRFDAYYEFLCERSYDSREARDFLARFDLGLSLEEIMKKININGGCAPTNFVPALEKCVEIERVLNSAEYCLIDGRHRAFASALNGKPVHSRLMESMEDIITLQQDISEGKIADFSPGGYPLEKLVSLEELSRIFLTYALENFNVEFRLMTLREQTDLLVSQGELPEYMNKVYLAKKAMM